MSTNSCTVRIVLQHGVVCSVALQHFTGSVLVKEAIVPRVSEWSRRRCQNSARGRGSDEGVSRRGIALPRFFLKGCDATVDTM